MRILVTGASGFVGNALCRHLHQENISVVGVSRKRPAEFTDITWRRMPELTAGADWSDLLADVDVIIHAAARVHVMRDTSADPLAEFRRINTEGTMALARQAANAGVRRFVFVSSIKVNGEETSPGCPFLADSLPAPSDAYAVSKYEAELALQKLAQQMAMSVTIVRPPLVYGPGVQANFLSMMRWLRYGIPLPLGAIANQRSLVALGNLTDLLRVCALHPGAVNQTFLAADGADVSTSELLRRLAHAMGKRVHLLPVSPKLLQCCATLLGKRDVVRRLCASLQVDIAKTCSCLQWAPPLSLDAALQQTAKHFLSNPAR